jgi:type II secretory pathway component HofQ
MPQVGTQRKYQDSTYSPQTVGVALSPVRSIEDFPRQESSQVVFSETPEAAQNFRQQGLRKLAVSMRLLKQVANKAAGEKTPEAYPLGYVEDFSRRERSWAPVSATA